MLNRRRFLGAMFLPAAAAHVALKPLFAAPLPGDEDYWSTIPSRRARCLKVVIMRG